MDSFEKHTVEEVANMAEHAELIHGNIVIENKTTVTHNLAVSEIATSLKKYISSQHGGDCRVFTENVALYCNELTQSKDHFFLPDVMVVCDPEGIDDTGVHVAPLFVAEVTSEATRKNDYFDKMMVYREIGVEEYWVVDIQRKIVNKYLLSNDYPETYIYPETVKVSVYPELSIDLSEFMRSNS